MSTLILPPDALLDAGLHPLEVFVGHVVDGRLRQLHRELLGAGRDRGKHAARQNADCGKLLQGRLHWIGPPKLMSCHLAIR